MSLNTKQRLFAYEYVKDFNATKAAKRCGYSKKTARQQGTRLLSKVAIKKAINKLVKKRTDKAIMDRDEMLRELTIIGRSDLRDYVDIDPDTGAIRVKGFENMPEMTSRALKAIKEDRVIKEDADGHKVTVFDKIRFELHDKLKGIELLAKLEGMLKEGDAPPGNVYVQVISAVPRPEKKE